MNLLPLIPSFNSTFSNERYLGYHSFENVNCKYSNYDKLNEISRLSNRSYQLNNSDKFQDRQNSRHYEGDLMQVVNEPNKYNEAGREFNASMKDGREFNSTQLNNTTKNNVKSNTNSLRKRNYDASPDKLNIKRPHLDEISNKYNEIFNKESCGTSKEAQNDDKRANIIDEDDLTDYFIGTEKMRGKSYLETVGIKACLPRKLSEEDIRIEQESLSCIYDVFDYAHKSVDVEKLPIVDPNCNTKGIKECYSVQSDLLQLCSVASKPLTNENDCVVSDNKGVVRVTLPGLINFSGNEQQVDKQWKIVRIDCPLRVQVSSSDVNLKNCSARDPRLSHLRS